MTPETMIIEVPSRDTFDATSPTARKAHKPVLNRPSCTSDGSPRCDFDQLYDASFGSDISREASMPSKPDEDIGNAGKLLVLPLLQGQDFDGSFSSNDSIDSSSSSQSLVGLGIPIPGREMKHKGSSCSDRLRKSFKNHFLRERNGKCVDSLFVDLERLDALPQPELIHAIDPCSGHGNPISFSIRKSSASAYYTESQAIISESNRPEQVPVGLFVSFCNAERTIRRPFSKQLMDNSSQSDNQRKTMDKSIQSDNLRKNDCAEKCPSTDNLPFAAADEEKQDASPRTKLKCRRRIAALKRMQHPSEAKLKVV